MIGNRYTAGRTHYSTSIEPPDPRTLCSQSAGDCLQSPCSAAHTRQPTQPRASNKSMDCVSHLHIAGGRRLLAHPAYPCAESIRGVTVGAVPTPPNTAKRVTQIRLLHSISSHAPHFCPFVYTQVCCMHLLAGAGTLGDLCHY